MKKSPAIADYDSVSYDYETYWTGREYEDAADKLALTKLLKDKRARISNDTLYIDIGGSYGREVETYAPFVGKIILFDYSLNSLKKAKRYLESRGIPNVTYVAGNVYFLPFADNSINSGQMVRVMHHINNADKAINEIFRVINTSFFLEAANKLHGKFMIVNSLKLNFKEILNNKPMQQKFRSTSQGSHGEDQIFLNYPYRYLSEIISKTGFKVKRVLSVSNLRFPILKKTLGMNLLMALENTLQESFSGIHFGPSTYFLLTKNIKNVEKNIQVENIICCPKCKGKLKKTDSAFTCDSDKLEFKIDEGVYDFRYSE